MQARWLSVLRYFGLAQTAAPRVSSYSAVALLREDDTRKFHRLYPARVIDYINGAELWGPDGYSGCRFRVYSRGCWITVDNWGFA